MKKAKSLLALILLLAIVLTACSSTSSTTSESPEEASPTSSAPEASVSAAEPEAEPETVTDEAPASLLPVTEDITTYTLLKGIDPRIVDMVDINNLGNSGGYAEITRLSNIKFDITGIAAMAYNEQFQLMMAGGDYCDAIYGVEDNYSTGTVGALEDDVIIDLKDLIQEHVPNLWNNYIERYDDLKALAINDNGQIGSLPLLLGEPGQENTGYAIRYDWLSQLGMELPQTMEELEKYMYAANDQFNAKIPITVDYNFELLANAMGFSIGGLYRPNDGNELQSGWTGELAYQYIEKLHQWYSDGLISEDFISKNMTEYQFEIASGKCSVAPVNGASDLIALYSYGDDESAIFSGISALPMTEDGEIGYGKANSIVKNYAEWSISTSCEDPVPLMKLMNFLYTDEGRIVNSYGTEGVSFVRDENGQPQWTDLIINNPDGLSYVVARGIYGSCNMPGILDLSRDYYNFTDREWEAYNTFKGIDKDLCNLPAAAMKSLTTEESIEAALLAVDIETYITESVGKWVTGADTLDEASFSAYESALSSMGIDRYTEIYQTAYNRYLEKINK